MVLDGPINGEWFFADVEQVLCPTLKAGDIVVLDWLGSHRTRIREAIETCRASLSYLPKYSPGPEPHRNGLLQAQGPAPQGRRTIQRSPLEPHRSAHRRLHTRRMRQLLQSRRIWCSVSGFRSRMSLPWVELAADRGAAPTGNSRQRRPVSEVDGVALGCGAAPPKAPWSDDAGAFASWNSERYVGYAWLLDARLSAESGEVSSLAHKASDVVRREVLALAI